MRYIPASLGISDRRRAILALFVGVLLCTGSGAGAPLEARSAIQMEYDKVCEAVRLKYVDGMVMCHAPGFTAYDLKGLRTDTRVNEDAFRKLFATSISAKFTVEIISFHQVAPNRATCRVSETLEVVKADPRPQQSKDLTYFIDSTSDDEWRSTDGWQQVSSRLISQSVRRPPVSPPTPRAK